jgi:hypothetical protein
LPALKSAAGHLLKSSFNQMETPAHFSLNRAHGAIRKPSFRFSIQSHSSREADGFLPDDLNASDGFAPRPTSDSVQTRFSQVSVAKAGCDRFRHASYLAQTHCEYVTRLDNY